MRALLTAAVTLALVACGGARPAPPEPVTATADKDTRRATTEYVRGLVRQVYRAVRRGKGATMQTLVAGDAVVTGPRAEDLFGSRGDAVVAAASRFEVNRRHKVRSRGLITESSPSGTSAWVADRVDIDRKRYVLVAVLGQVDEIWYALAVNLGRVSGDTDAESAPALPLGAANGTGEVVDLVRAGAAEPAKFLEQLAEHKQTTVIGPGARDYARGARRIARLWKKRKIADTPLAITGEPRPGITPDGSLAWVMAHVTLGEGHPQRVMWIYERAGDSGWRLVLMQSAPVKASPTTN